MTDDPVILAGTFKSRRLLAAGETLVKDLLDLFESAALEAAANPDKSSQAEMNRVRLLYAKARNELIEEVNKHETHVLEARGLVATAPIDFDRLRAEIGRSLDRVRAAREAEGVPGEPF